MHRTAAPLDREQLAERLLRASVRHSHDPLTEIAWDEPIDPGRPAMPPHRCSLYGTALWDSLGPQEQAALCTRQFAGLLTWTLWGELMLMEGLIRHVYDEDPATRHAQYALTEVADECRHSIMFGRYLTLTGHPTQVGPAARRLGRWLLRTNCVPLLLATTLFVEEFIEAAQREVMRDESLQPLARSVSRIHVIEEARHIGYASAELRHSCRAFGPARRAALAQALAVTCAFMVREAVPPRMYALAGLDARAAHRAAAANPHWHRATATWSRKAVALFRELGILDRWSEPIWRRARLID
ncbi:P-aminobenzoate N-oxygenase AurF [Streptomyces sp. DvalAA-14]|nr:diiron oxygenase [Streptomyces sp. SID4948]SCD35577.1 P-aminobenzoate N-oxygenase AurF [Streptomyces sp. DvalAA-14]